MWTRWLDSIGSATSIDPSHGLRSTPSCSVAQNNPATGAIIAASFGRRVMRRILRPTGLEVLWSHRSALRRTGWLRSYREWRIVDAEGAELPWLTYPAIAFLSSRLPVVPRVGEFGSGFGTYWWARRAQTVTSVEHDARWVDRLRETLPAHASIVHRQLESDGYPNALAESGGEFDVIVIDGRRRVDCAIRSVPALAAGGVLVWDDAERPYYSAGFEFLARRGFRRVDFTGMGPRNVRQWSTAIFYRDGNCLGL